MHERARFRTSSCLLLIGALAGSCQERARTPPPPAPASPGLKPLTSRDGSPCAVPPRPEDHGGLPPGHPPRPRRQWDDDPDQAVSGTIDISPSLRRRQGPTDALFIIARSAASRQILAVRKEKPVSFPHAFRISGRDAMIEGTPFQGPFDLTARLSKSGDAFPTRGDLEGTARSVPGGAHSLRLTLDTVRQ